MDTLDPMPTVIEVEQLIERNQSVQTKWKGNPGYVRGLMIEWFALHALLMLIKAEQVKPYYGDDPECIPGN
jgi:hypothetical protein